MKSDNKAIDIQYILTTKNFFSEGPCGRVSHAYGFIKGCIDNNASIELLAEKNAKIFLENISPNLKILSPKKENHLNFLLYSFKKSKKRKAIVIRWRPIIPYIYIFILFRNHNCWLEINSITGIDSKSKLVCLFSKISIKIAAKFFNIITVSENSLEKIKTISILKRKNIIMPNGFLTEYFKETTPPYTQSKLCSLVYFGKKQNYYDWDILYSIAPNLIKTNIINGIEIFGFEEMKEQFGVNYHGSFTQENIVSKISKIKNPILILHVSNSEIGRSGSPMKLFEYAALGLPVIISSSLKKQAFKFKNFNFYNASDKLDLISTIERTCKNYPLEIIKAKSSMEIAHKNYSWKATVTPWLHENKII